MKRIFLSIVVGWGLVGGLETARAQENEKPIPHKPYLAPVPDYGHWMVTFKYGANAGDAAAGKDKPPSVPDGFPVSIETIKTSDLRGVTVTYPNGKSRQFTCQGDWVLASTAKGAQLSIATPKEHPYIFYTAGFILLDGVKIDPSTYKETAMHNDVLAFHYKSGDTDVWIDPTTMFPLTVQKLDIEVSYEFLTPPPRPFDIPPDQAALLKKEQEAAKSTGSMR